MGHEWPWVKLGSHSLRQTLSTKSKYTEPFPLLIPALVSVSLLFHPSCLSRSSVRLARAHQRCPELLRGTQSLGDLFLPPQCNLLLLLPSYESVSLLQHKVHLSAHVAPPELLRGKGTFFTWENKTKRDCLLRNTKCQWHFGAGELLSQQYGERTKSCFSQQLCFSTCSDLGTCKLPAIN